VGVSSGGAGRDGRRFVDPLGAEVPFDGASPIGWYLAANVLVVREGRVLLVRQPPAWGGRWELPGGGPQAGEALLAGAARECREETGYRFVAASPAPAHVEEAWFWTSRGGYAHAVVFVFRGAVAGDPDPAWTQDRAEIAEVAWLAPRHLSAATTRSIHWPALQRAGLV
jgi:8-oxo-dGTP pyrophosphatase MutT (NUDIX family)